jgi:two-component system, chemotaxis family, CheB/CheR fusion protein
MYGWSQAEALGMNIRDLIPEEHREEALSILQRLGRAETIESCSMPRITRDGRVVEAWLTSSALLDERGKMYAIATTERVPGLER